MTPNTTTNLTMSAHHRVSLATGKLDQDLAGPTADVSDGVFPPICVSAYVLTGPTASGKSRLAIDWARQIGGEILSLDSIAVYRHMDIGSAKPSSDEQASVPHHLIDLVNPNEEFSVACYLQAAHRLVAEIRGRGKTPIFVGGTPMYLKAILRGFDPGPPADPVFRNAAEEDLDRYGIEALYARLQQVDPLAAHRIQPTDSRRMIRALEVAHLTGIPISHRQVQFEKAATTDHRNVFALAWERSELHQRIETRVNQMFESGLVDEVQSILDQFGSISKTAAQGVGYREVLEHLDGKWTLDQCIEQVVFHTRRLARRQETWFRSLDEIKRIEMNQTVSAQAALSQMEH
ncbi:IPP transferase [Rubripirellula obstinata]|uniref:tRNA dimethylallyltransferase n=1 Tax=Rubripirellula obstinata TaxID=406547 RepID=A0A5B1CM79_9BACT|nr:tRNA (adenosine(37)-N6)-dimethylallyltransferase MiaA [Rubripirellula obstinata]KAA1262287.1 IPP transferase [Rubripirellula obstinata]